MLTRQDDLSPSQKYYSDTLLTLPTTRQSVFDNFAAGVATPFVALNNLNSTEAAKPEGRAMNDTLSAIQMENQTPGMGWGQYGANQVASLIGYGINPITWGFGEMGALGAKGLGAAAEAAAPDAVSTFMSKPIASYLSEPIAKWLSEQVGKEGAQKTLSAGLVSQKTLDNFSTFAGASVPAAIVDNFNNDTDHINWGGVARDAGEMGGMGIAIGSLPFALGLLKGKVNRGLDNDLSEPVTPQTLSEAVSKKIITPEEHQWYTDYLEHQQNPQDVKAMADLQNRATQIIGKNGQDVNAATNEVPFDFLKPEDVKNLLNSTPDQLVSDVPDNLKTALSDYLINNRLDQIREDPKALDGLQGYVDSINQKLETKPSKLAESDKILDDHLMTGTKENMPLAQKEIVKQMRKTGFKEANLSQLPITIPKNIISHFKQLEKIDSIKTANKNIFKQYKKTGDSNLIERMKVNSEKMDTMKGNLEPLLSPAEELQDIRKTLITDKGLPKNWERSKAYHRLLDLSQVWQNAKSLLDRVHLERDYDRQEAFKTISDHILKIADSDMPRLAQPDNVVNYLKARIEGNVLKKEPIELAEYKARAASEVPSDSESILNEQQLQVDNSSAKDLAKEFTAASDKFKEFKSSEGVFKNLISCVMGAING